MRLRPRTWFILSLLLFAAAAFFWHLGELRRNAARREAAPRDTRTQGFTLTNTVPAAAAAVVQPAVAAASTAASVVNTRTNPFAYRLTNTSKTVGQLIHDDRGLLLRNALLDTANPAPLPIPPHLRASGDPGSYIVQASGAINDSFRKRVLQSGARLVSYIPNNAMLVRADAGQVKGLSGPEIASVLPFEPYYKLDPKLLPIAVEKERSPYGELNVVAFPQDTERARKQIEGMGGVVLSEPERTPFGDNLVVRVPARGLAALAQIREVQMIGVRTEKRLMNDLSRVRVNVSTNTVTTVAAGSHYLGLGGSNVLVAITDSGADGSHDDLIGRIWNLTTELEDGHGTHIAGTILGNGSASLTVGSPDGTNSFAQGSTNGAIFSGMAPYATGYVHYYNRGTDIKLQQDAALSGANINNNSWGYAENGYDIFAASYDAAVRDSLSGVVGEQPMTYVFAAGNSGVPSARILSPATAKNVITVGGSELFRHITNEVWKCTTVTNGSGSSTTTCDTNRPWFDMTDSDNQVAPFSSRGNVGIGLEGPNGRFKPDVVAPGAMLVSCRSGNFVNPTNLLSTFEDRFSFEELDGTVTNLYSVAIPANCVSVRMLIANNPASSANQTSLWISAEMNVSPTGGPLGSNDVTLTPPAIFPGTLYITVANPSTNVVNYDLIVRITITNALGNYWEVLADLNDQLAPKPLTPKYRYEQGTSMSAGVVSGVLALMEEYYKRNFNVTNSPAMNKALLVNGARSLGIQYNLDPHASANQQGWGLVNISNSAPAGLQSATNQALYFFDQSTNSALATGDSQVYTITVPARARSIPLRITLAWTDPAGNPVSGPKLVNDLDLFVDGPAIALQGTNALITTNRWLGNNFAAGTDYTVPLVLTDTNGTVATNITDLTEAARDNVNNVENVYIAPPLGGTYTVVVKGRRVNVNAVNSHPNGIVQDYALVISSGNLVTTNAGISVSAPVPFSEGAPFVTALQMNGATKGAVLMNQRVGANSPYLTSTNGMTNQWAFFTFSNLTTFTNVAIITFLTPNLGFLRPDPNLDPHTPRTHDGDIDLYVAHGPGVADPGMANPWNLTNLDASVIAASDRSTGRGGTEFVVYSNAAQDQVFYIGVKAEDQQSATFGIFAVASQQPFSQRDSNNIVAQALFLPVEIPDGTPDEPGGTNVFVFVPDPDTVQRIYLTNVITHEDAGDLIGILSHNDATTGQDAFATLNNHRYWSDLDVSVYDDSGQGDITWSIPSDGPGSLNDFVGHQASGLWTFTISDNALFHTGSVEGLTLVIEPASTNADLPVDIVRTIGPNGWLRAAFDVNSPDITNIHAAVGIQSGPGPVNLYLRRSLFPTLTRYDKATNGITPPGGSLDLGFNDSPPLSLGRYFVAVYNDSANPVTVHLTVRLDRSPVSIAPTPLANNGTLPLLDDAFTNSTIFVATQALVSRIEVDVRLDHPRASDLVLYLVDPEGTRVMLAENRGRDLAKGYGLSIASNILTTNFGARVFDNGFEDAPLGAPPPGAVFSGWLNINAMFKVVTNGNTGTNAITSPQALPGEAIATNILLTPGKLYSLSVAFTPNPDNPDQGRASATVEITNTPASKFFLLDTILVFSPNRSWTNLLWVTQNHLFYATDRTNSLQISAILGETNTLLLDTVRIDEVETNVNSRLYATFTDDPAKLPIPIKFAPPPFGDSTFSGTNVFISGFESTNKGVYTNGQTFDGWTVITNSVFVQSNSALAYSDTNYLFLRTGIVSRVLPTVAGKEYVLQFATRTDGKLIYNTGVDQDNVPLGFGEVDSHYSFSNASPSSIAFSNAVVLPTNVMSSTWFNQTNGGSRWIGVSATDTTIPPGDVVYRTTFDLRGYDTNSVQIKCDFATDDQLINVLLNGIATGIPPGGNPLRFTTLNLNKANGGGFRQRTNTLEFVVRNIGVTPHGFRAEPIITGVPLPLALPRIYTAVGQVKLLGAYTNSFVAGSDAWRVQNITFVAGSNNTTLEFSGLTPGVWLDHVQIRDTGRKYYLPEEPLAPLLGQQAFGPWSLQIWDSRLGADVTAPTLLSWRLNLSFVRTNPPFTRLINNAPQTGTNAIQYFVVDVPCDPAAIDNTLSSSGPVDLLFNQDTFPTGTQPGDVVLASGVTASTTIQLRVGFYPLVRSGPYYLAVRNSSTNTATFTIEADINCAVASSAQPLALGKPTLGPSGLSLYWTSEPAAEFSVLSAQSPAGPWITLATKVTSATSAFTFTDNGAATGGLPQRRFYRLLRTK